MSDDQRAIRGQVSGRVQGVFYRASFQREAVTRGLTGWVRNLPDGRVEFTAQGPSERVQELVDWATVGPPAARVLDLKVEEIPLQSDSHGFQIRY